MINGNKTAQNEIKRHISKQKALIGESFFTRFGGLYLFTCFISKSTLN